MLNFYDFYEACSCYLAQKQINTKLWLTWAGNLEKHRKSSFHAYAQAPVKLQDRNQVTCLRVRRRRRKARCPYFEWEPCLNERLKEEGNLTKTGARAIHWISQHDWACCKNVCNYCQYWNILSVWATVTISRPYQWHLRKRGQKLAP